LIKITKGLWDLKIRQAFFIGIFIGGFGFPTRQSEEY